MRTVIVGAGPAGLYLAILLRKADPSHEVTVLERNAADATYGWGVVFSEETMGALRDADGPTHAEITDAFARWGRIDIRYRGEITRSRGNSFSAMSRKHLLAMLQRRATELGAVLEFGVEVDGIPDADLVVASDGANSRLRKAYARQLRPSVAPQGGKYAWYGTDLVFDAFTFIFTETGHGLFQVHAYPFDEHTSTFIVECQEDVWRRAGLDAMTEAEGLAFCENLFAEHLDGHRLMSNRSLWNSFPMVRVKNWHCRLETGGHLVLLGDTAHTAHFSIGSGTKLAMEDSISLAAALVAHPGDVPAALTAYELDRQPVVERFQQAATESAAYFSRTAHYTHFVPTQFAVNLLTRSGRIGHANLAQRDPALVMSLDSWFSAQARGGEPVAVAPPPAFAPLTIGGLTLPNRLVSEAGSGSATGAGLLLTGFVAVRPDGRTTEDCPVMDSPSAWTSAVAQAHDAGSRIGVRLGHAGAMAAVRPPEFGADTPLAHGWELIAATAKPRGPRAPVPRAMTADDETAIRDAFTAAAAHAVDAGFDLLELDMAGGHLLAGFLPDRPGFPLSVLDAVRAVWPGALAVRLSVGDDGVAIARELAGHGADLIHVRGGGGAPEYRAGWLTPASDRVRNQARVPTLVGGYLTTTDEVNTVLAAGRADLCLLDLR